MHDQTKPRIRWRAFGLSQQSRRGAFPRPRHRAEHGGQLRHAVLGEAFFGLKLVGPQGLQQRLAPVPFDVVEHIGVQPCHIDGIGLDKTSIQSRCGPLAHAFAIIGITRVVHADVHHRPRPAPVGVLARGAHAQQRVLGEFIGDRLQIRDLPLRDIKHGTKGQRHGARHRQIKTD